EHNVMVAILLPEILAHLTIVDLTLLQWIGFCNRPRDTLNHAIGHHTTSSNSLLRTPDTTGLNRSARNGRSSQYAAGSLPRCNSTSRTPMYEPSIGWFHLPRHAIVYSAPATSPCGATP